MRKHSLKVLWLIAMLVLTSSAFAQKIAVLNFNAGVGINQNDVDGISSIFNTYFEPKGAEIIERTRVDRLLQEHEFQRSKFTTSDMVAVGKILNVSLVVVGDVNIVMGQYNVDIRVVNVQTGTVVAKDGISFNKNTSYRGTMQQLGIRLSKKMEAEIAKIKVKSKPRKPEIGEVKEEEIFIYVDEPASFPGGVSNMHEYIKRNTRYPQTAIENGVEGIVHVTFVVEKDGSLTNIEVSRGIEYSLDKEAVRCVKSMPRWNPARRQGKVVRMRYNLPIRFYFTS